VAKRILLFILQFCAFFGLMFLGGNWDGVNLGLEIKAMQNHTTPHILIPTIKTQIGTNHILIANGLIFAAVLLVLILIFEAFRKAFKPWALLSFLAFILAVATAFAWKIGLPPLN
jgi:hypothetical protein